MKIKTTFTTETEKEISTPLFLRTDYSYFAVLDENTEVSILLLDNHTSVRNSKPNHNDIARNIAAMQPCSEVEFMDALDKAISIISLKPILHESTN